ncbi:MAG: hypothetical protein ACRD1Z_03790, partial [Vicinamibacteria bacterium]
MEELAGAGKLESLAKAVLRELRGRRIDASLFDFCWKVVAVRRWETKLEDFIAAWDKAAAIEAPAPAQSLFRARLASLASKPEIHRDLLEAAAKKFPGEPAILWFLGKARFDFADHASAAGALEEMASLKGYPFDRDEFHRILVRSYAETGRRAAAIEHLRAVDEELSDISDLALLAFRCRLFEEAVRLFRVALIADPERISRRMWLVKALRSSGEEDEAAVERKRMCMVDDRIAPGKVEDYFVLLPPEGRAEEIVQTLRNLLEKPEDAGEAPKLVDALAVKVPAEERGPVAAAWEKSARDARDWMILGGLKRHWGSGLEPALEVLEKGEKLFPRDPFLTREKLDTLE